MQSLIRHILFPVDFSARCDAIVPAVVAMAQKFKARITLLHVFDLHHMETEFGALQEHITAISDAVQGRLADYQKLELRGVDVDRVFKMGHSAHEIVDIARTENADLIMMPTHGFTRFRWLLLGSVTASILHDVHCPVWTTAHAEDLPAPPTDYKSVVCAVDLTPAAAPVLLAAKGFASAFGASLHVVHAISPIESRIVSGVAANIQRFTEDEAREAYAALASKTGIEEPLEIVEEHGIVASIVSAEERHGADLLIIGRGAIQGVLGRLRTNAHDLIRMSQCPVLSI